MNRRWNWPLWLGLVLSIIAFGSYYAFFVRFPMTRDFPWVNILFFAAALALIVVGIKRAFAPGGGVGRKVLAGFVGAIGVLIAVMFGFLNLVVARQLPSAGGAPHVGDKAPEFVLLDTEKRPVALWQLLAEPLGGRPAKGVLLVFYRGYW
jgi:hypothetical protein